jgi:hypothetical protein
VTGGLEPFDELRVSSSVEKLGAERLPSTCSGPELVEGGRVGGRRHFRALWMGDPLAPSELEGNREGGGIKHGDV